MKLTGDDIIRRNKSGIAPGFKPVGEVVAPAVPITSIIGNAGDGAKTSEDDKSHKVAEKKMKLAKYGLKFQSAGTLVTIGDRIEKDTPIIKGTAPTNSKELTEVKGRGEARGGESEHKGAISKDRGDSRNRGNGGREESSRNRGHESKDRGNRGREEGRGKGGREEKGGAPTRREVDRRKLIDQTKASYTTKWEKAGSSKKDQVIPSAPSKDDKAPPPLMSRQRELTMEKYANRLDDDEETDFTAKTIIKKTPTFKFKIAKN